jgi:LysR family transcriptional regulator of gallate degradation
VRPRVGRPALQRAQWVLSRPGSPSRELLVRAFREAGDAAPVPAVETGDLALLRGLLLQSDMVTAISAHQLRYEIETGALVVLPYPLESTRRRIGLTQRRNALPSPAAKALIDAVRQVVAARM